LKIGVDWARMTRDDEGELMSKMPLKTRKARGVVVFAGEHEEADRTSFWKRESVMALLEVDGGVEQMIDDGAGRRRKEAVEIDLSGTKQI